MFSKNRDRLLKAEVARNFLAGLLTHKEVRALLSDEHFSVDGTQVQAWASMKSFVAKDGSSEPPSSGRNGERDFHGEKRRNDTHASATEPEAKLYKKGKGKEAKLSYIGNVMTENRNGFVVEAELRMVSGTVKREAATAMIVRHSPGAQRITIGGDKGFDAADFVADTTCAARRSKHDRSPLRHRRPTTRHSRSADRLAAAERFFDPLALSLADLIPARPMLRGVKKPDFKFIWTMAAYDLIELPRLIGATA